MIRYLAAFITGALAGFYAGSWFLTPATDDSWRSGDYDPASDTFTSPSYVHWASTYSTGTSGPAT